jgi:hypothetical protein
VLRIDMIAVFQRQPPERMRCLPDKILYRNHVKGRHAASAIPVRVLLIADG